MQWKGKAVGTLVGLLAGPVGAVVGAIIGHGYDLSRDQSRGAAAGSGARVGAGAGGDLGEIAEALFATAFAVMGHLAKADGRVSPAEIEAARGVMRRMQLDDAQVARAIECFERGKRADYPFADELARLRELCAGRHDLLRLFLEIQVQAALAGNDLQGPVRARLQTVARDLGFGGLELAGLEAALRLRQAGAGPRRAPAGLRTAYEILGIAEAASDEAVKKAYRRQMSENHPDKLVARGLPESMQELAKEKTQRIREAYEAICEHRGLR